MKKIFIIITIILLIKTVDADQPGKKTIFYQSVEWSHDGKSICFAAIILDSGKYENGRWEIYTMNIDGSSLKKITENNFNDMWPSYSPDNITIYFQSDRDGNQEIYSMNVDGSSPQRLTENPAMDVTPACSPDGTKILFTSMRDGNQDLYLVNSDGSNGVRLTNTDYKECNPAWSPDGKKIIYYCEKGDRRDQIYICNSDGSNQTNITNDSLNNIYPAYSSNGSEIIYQSSHYKEKHVCLINVKSRNKKEISTSGFFNRLSPDGKYLAFISSGWPQSEISLSKADGSVPKIISNKEEILKLDKR